MNKRVGFILSLLIVLSVFQISLVLAESGSGSNGAGNSDNSGSSSETKVKADSNKIKIQEKARMGNVKSEVKTDIRGNEIRMETREEWKNESGEFRQEVRQEIRTMVADERERKLIEFKTRIENNKGNIRIDNKTVMVKIFNDENKEIIAGRINAKTGLNLTAEDIDNRTVLKVYLSNGRHAEIKIMPDRASDIAVAKMRAKCEERNCTVELREVSEGNKSRAHYIIQTQKDARTLGIFKANMRIRAEVDSETGEIIGVKKPWWAFLAKEKNEAEVITPVVNGTVNSSINTSVDPTVPNVNLTVNTSIEADVNASANVSI